MYNNPPKWAVVGSTKFKLNDYIPLLRSYKTTKRITPSFQANQLKELLQGPRDELVCISGTKTEAMPYYMACSISDKYAQKINARALTWVSLRSAHMPFLDDKDERLVKASCSAIVFYNILPDSSIYRIEKLKDCLDIAASKGIMRIIVLGGMPPYEFCVERLRVKPACGIYLESNV